MNYFTTDCYEMKREILNFSKKVSKGLDKTSIKLVSDMQYGLSKSKSYLILEISKSLKEDIKLKNTIERLCDNLSKLSNDKVSVIKKLCK